MCEDEILKDIDNYISFANKSENFSDINEYLHCKELARRMKGLLDLYNKEKNSNQWLLKAFDESRNNNIELAKECCKIQEELKQEKEKNKKLLNSKIGVDLSYEDYIRKDKIKEIVNNNKTHIAQEKIKKILEEE